MTARKSQSWEDFKREAFGGRTEEIGGVTVRVPTDVPLILQDLAEDLSADSKVEDFNEVVTLLYGDGVFEQWLSNGMGGGELMTALMWGMLQGSGRDVTFMEAYELVTSDDPGKVLDQPNRQARRAASRTRSASTGGRSKPTSSASTASTRKRSAA